MNRVVTVKEICKIKSGKRLPKGCDFSQTKTNYPYIRARDIKNGVINVEEIAYIDEDVHRKISKYIINTGDIAITIVGASIGDIGYAKSNVDGYNLTENAVRLTDFCSNVNSKYVFYYLSSEYGRKYMQQIVGGAAQPKLGIYKIEKIPILLPDFEIQCKIADILSAYDNLIENNQKQIKLLEEAAQRLYKEWFVDLRFPGYENTRVVDGVPEGWEKTELSKISTFVRGKTITQKDVVFGNVPVVAGGLEPAYYHNLSITEAPVITISGSGANAGFTRMYFEKIWASDCSYSDKTISKYLYFTYCFLKTKKAVLDNLKKGAAQPHVYVKDVNSIKFLCPCDKLISLFDKKIEYLFDKMAVCEKTINNSKQARDRLLPKLMSGEVEV